MALPAPGHALAERYAAWVETLSSDDIPDAVRVVVGRQLRDVTGLCVAARQSSYVTALREACEDPGACTMIGHAGSASVAEAALVNGTAAHGEDYDDTFEGTPVHAGAVIVPAVLAACEKHARSGGDVLKGIATGVELMCRMALVTPGAIHRAGFHPTAVIGTLGATAGVGAALGLPAAQIASALGIAGSLAAGIIEYLAEGTWTKRLHAGWAAQCGLRAAMLARAGFAGPRTVLDGAHGFFRAFSNGDVEPDFAPLNVDLGSRWLAGDIAFKPYACGTMAQPFIDCALSLRESGLAAEEITAIECNVGEGTVHRLWEPLDEKRRPPNGYAAKFSVPYCIAVAYFDGAAGLQQFADERVTDPRVRDLAARIAYRIDPQDEYPANYSGHLEVRLTDGTKREFRQPHLRGGRREPLSDSELSDKFRANARFGDWEEARVDAAEAVVEGLLGAGELSALSSLRG
jgi:2-methylcitrate dehydratase PrpD